MRPSSRAIEPVGVTETLARVWRSNRFARRNVRRFCLFCERSAHLRRSCWVAPARCEAEKVTGTPS
eukprot:8843212-Pyramimonas_sp.AAC.1